MVSLDAPQYKEQVRRDWAEGVGAWRAWHAQFTHQTRAATELLLAAAQVRSGMRVLDVGTGSGEPALSLATAVAPGGAVIASDLVSGMLTIAQEQADAEGLANITFQQADAEALPFPDAQFEVVTCRLSLMYCPDADRALREMLRVLKRGGRAALVVWGPAAENPYITTSIAIMQRHAQLPAPPPGTPSPFSFARAGSLATAMREAGFAQVREETRTIPFSFPGPPDACWRYIREIGGPAFSRIFAALTSAQYEQAQAEVLAAIARYYDGEQVAFPAVMHVASGVRPAE